jgi:hypothetical protein
MSISLSREQLIAIIRENPALLEQVKSALGASSAPTKPAGEQFAGPFSECMVSNRQTGSLFVPFSDMEGGDDDLVQVDARGAEVVTQPVSFDMLTHVLLRVEVKNDRRALEGSVRTMETHVKGSVMMATDADTRCRLADFEAVVTGTGGWVEVWSGARAQESPERMMVGDDRESRNRPAALTLSGIPLCRMGEEDANPVHGLKVDAHVTMPDDRCQCKIEMYLRGVNMTHARALDWGIVAQLEALGLEMGDFVDDGDEEEDQDDAEEGENVHGGAHESKDDDLSSAVEHDEDGEECEDEEDEEEAEEEEAEEASETQVEVDVGIPFNMIMVRDGEHAFVVPEDCEPSMCWVHRLIVKKPGVTNRGVGARRTSVAMTCAWEIQTDESTTRTVSEAEMSWNGGCINLYPAVNGASLRVKVHGDGDPDFLWAEGTRDVFINVHWPHGSDTKESDDGASEADTEDSDDSDEETEGEDSDSDDSDEESEDADEAEEDDEAEESEDADEAEEDDEAEESEDADEAEEGEADEGEEGEAEEGEAEEGEAEEGEAEEGEAEEGEAEEGEAEEGEAEEGEADEGEDVDAEEGEAEEEADEGEKEEGGAAEAETENTSALSSTPTIVAGP